MAEQLDQTTIATRSIKGVVALSIRYLLIAVISIAAHLVLQYKLDPSSLGVYAIVNAVIAILVYFSDIGLAAALIQKKEEITEADLKTTFTVQQLLIIVLVGIGFLLTPFVGSIY